MKPRFFYVFVMCLTVLFSTSCTKDMEYKDVQVSPVTQLYEPTDGQSVTLVASSTASLFFEWAAAKAEDSGSPLYEVVFDKVDGDFSNPVYRVVADNNGVRSYATITHKVLDKIGKAAGINGGETGTLKWTVVASRGLNSAMATESRTLTITCLKGFTELPNQVYLTGEATEGGTDITKAVPCSMPNELGVFEVFTKLEEGKSYRLVDNNSADAKSYYVNESGVIIEGQGETTVSKGGIYRIVFDFTTASVKMTEIQSLGFFFCPSNEVTFELPYKGNGVFEGESVIEFKQESWGRDQRYKFLMTYADGTTQMWGTKNTTDSNPGEAAADDPYFYITETANNQWDQKWKLNNEFDGAADGANPGAKTRISVIFSGDNYTHHVELVK